MPSQVMSYLIEDMKIRHWVISESDIIITGAKAFNRELSLLGGEEKGIQ